MGPESAVEGCLRHISIIDATKNYSWLGKFRLRSHWWWSRSIWEQPTSLGRPKVPWQSPQGRAGRTWRKWVSSKDKWVIESFLTPVRPDVDLVNHFFFALIVDLGDHLVQLKTELETEFVKLLLSELLT